MIIYNCLKMVSAMNYSLTRVEDSNMATAKLNGTKPVGDNIRYTTCSEHCFNMCIIKVHIRDDVFGQLSRTTRSTAASHVRTDTFPMS